MIPCGLGTTSGAALVRNVRGEGNWTDGGPVPGSYGFIYSGTVTNTNTPFTNNSWSASLVLNNGDTLTGTVAMKMVRVDADFRRAGPVPVSFEGMFTGAIG